MNPAYRPMLATLVNEPFDEKEWVFETKWDGFRLITEKHGNNVRLWSRNGIDATSRYAVLLPALQMIEDSWLTAKSARSMHRGARAFSSCRTLSIRTRSYYMSFLTRCSWTARTSGKNRCWNERNF